MIFILSLVTFVTKSYNLSSQSYAVVFVPCIQLFGEVPIWLIYLGRNSIFGPFPSASESFKELLCLQLNLSYLSELAADDVSW